MTHDALIGISSALEQVAPPPSQLPLALFSPEDSPTEFAHNHTVVGLHSHSCFKLIFVEAVEGCNSIDNTDIEAMPGALFIIAPDQAHDLSRLKCTKKWVVLFQTDFLMPRATETGFSLVQNDDLLLMMLRQSQAQQIRHFQIPSCDRLLWISCLRQLDQELRHKQLGFVEAARAILVQLLIEIARLAMPQTEVAVFKFNPLLSEVFQFIRSHYNQQISLKDVSRAVKLSPAYLTDLVRRETGRSVLKWIIAYRMVEARQLLLTTNYSVKNIAFAVGFMNVTHFIRQFRKYNQISPHAWRLVCRLEQANQMTA